MAVFGHFQNALIFRILADFSSRFLHSKQLECVCTNVFRMFFAYLILKPNCPFCMGYSLCIVAIFGHFQNALIFRILAIFRAVFCIEQLECVCTNVFRMFFAYLILKPNWPFCMGYSLCIVAIFGHFQNALIFRILAVFSSRFLHRTT